MSHLAFFVHKTLVLPIFSNFILAPSSSFKPNGSSLHDIDANSYPWVENKILCMFVLCLKIHFFQLFPIISNVESLYVCCVPILVLYIDGNKSTKFATTPFPFHKCDRPNMTLILPGFTNMNNTTGATCGAGSAYFSGAPGIPTPCF